MVNLMYLIIACHYLIVRGKTPIPKKEDKCKTLLAAAGCDDGKLLDKNVCIRKDYNRLIYAVSAIHITILKFKDCRYTSLTLTISSGENLLQAS